MQGTRRDLDNTGLSFNAAVLVGQSQPLEITRVSPSERLTQYQVLVRVTSSGVCGSQLGEIDGVRGPDRYLPHMLGHEGFGKVEEIGPGVSSVSVGDSVVLHWREGIGGTGANATYVDERGRKINSGKVTTLSEYSVVSENRLTRVPHDLDPNFAPLLGCALTTGFGAVVREARVQPGSTVVVLGVGGVGMSIIASLQLVSPSRIIAVDVSRQKLDFAIDLGAMETLNLEETRKPLDDLSDLLGDGADFVFEASGKKASIELGYAILGPHGHMQLVGVPSAETPAQLDTLGLHLGKTISGSNGGSTMPSSDIPAIIDLVERGKIHLEKIPVATFGLNEVNAGISALRDGLPGRVVIRLS